ncbi:NAD-dependent epimerase/dehydratase family protein [Jatrophihabitans sp. DSM 45814]
MKVLLTGSAGKIGTMLRDRLPGLGHQIVEFDRDLGNDITDPESLDAALAGPAGRPCPADPSDPSVRISAIVHLAGQSGEAPWATIRQANIEGTFQVFEAARRAGIRRVIVASSNHAVGFTEHPDHDLDAATPPRPDTLYGVSKAFGEALGRYYVDRYGFQVACLRIGSCAELPANARALATWLSPDDCARLVDASLRTKDLTYALVWGVSANRHRWWSLSAGAAMGYEPVDDAFAVRPELAVSDRSAVDALVGGEFTQSAYGIDQVAERRDHSGRDEGKS